MGFYNVLIWKRFTFYSACAQAFASLGPQHLALGLLCPQPFEILYSQVFCNSNVVFSAQQKHVHGHIRTSWTMQVLVQWFLSHFRSSLIDFFPLSLFFFFLFCSLSSRNHLLRCWFDYCDLSLIKWKVQNKIYFDSSVFSVCVFDSMNAETLSSQVGKNMSIKVCLC